MAVGTSERFGIGITPASHVAAVRRCLLCGLVVDRHRDGRCSWLACRDGAAAPRLALGSVRALARTGFWAMGIPVSVIGIDRIPRGGAVLAFNHASYVDAFVVAATIRGAPAYVAKKELADQAFVGPLLRRLGVLFLDRYAVAESLADLEAVTAAGRQGRVLVFFPEGTFTRRAGLSGFYLGAFQGCCASLASGCAGHPVRNAIDVAKRSMVSAMERDQRQPRRPGRIDRHRFRRSGKASRFGPPCCAGGLR